MVAANAEVGSDEAILVLPLLTAAAGEFLLGRLAYPRMVGRLWGAVPLAVADAGRYCFNLAALLAIVAGTAVVADLSFDARFATPVRRMTLTVSALCCLCVAAAAALGTVSGGFVFLLYVASIVTSFLAVGCLAWHDAPSRGRWGAALLLGPQIAAFYGTTTRLFPGFAAESGTLAAGWPLQAAELMACAIALCAPILFIERKPGPPAAEGRLGWKPGPPAEGRLGGKFRSLFARPPLVPLVVTVAATAAAGFAMVADWTDLRTTVSVATGFPLAFTFARPLYLASFAAIVFTVSFQLLPHGRLGSERNPTLGAGLALVSMGGLAPRNTYRILLTMLGMLLVVAGLYRRSSKSTVAV